MLNRLLISNLALIQNCEIELSDGFSVFTGETGAGKSILMGAIGLLLGNRAISEHIRSGESEASVEGFFKLKEPTNELLKLLEIFNISIENSELLIKRVIKTNSKNRVTINDTKISLTALKEIGEHLFDLHGQHDHQTLLQDDAPFTIIDTLASVEPKRVNYLAKWKAYSVAKEQLKSYKKRLQDLKERKSFLEFQHKEIAVLELVEDEESLLEKEYKLLSSVTDRAMLAGRVENLLEGETGGLSSDLSKLLSYMEELGEIDNRFKEWSGDLIDVTEVLRDLSGQITSYRASVHDEANPARVDDINYRMSQIQKLKKRYDCDYSGLLKKELELSEELSLLNDNDSSVEQLIRAKEEAYEILLLAGNKLTESRKRAIKDFDFTITNEMSKLGFLGGGFKTELTPSEEPTAKGLENMTFMVKTNRGEPFMELVRTASGGEISRIMLAIKSILAENDPVPTLIFDEIDTGVGGERASDIARAMLKLSEHHQIFVISHLHQIASEATHHYSVYKKEVEGRTITEIERLNKSQRVDEIARMLGGINSETTHHASALLG